MLGSKQVLTVSYGSFSCTLKGFDNPFDTLKSIVDYFQALSDDDPSFGVDRRIPDEADLRRIAGEGDETRIDSRISDGRIILQNLDSAEDDSSPDDDIADTGLPNDTAEAGQSGIEDEDAFEDEDEDEDEDEKDDETSGSSSLSAIRAVLAASRDGTGETTSAPIPNDMQDDWDTGPAGTDESDADDEETTEPPVAETDENSMNASAEPAEQPDRPRIVELRRDNADPPSTEGTFAPAEDDEAESDAETAEASVHHHPDEEEDEDEDLEGSDAIDTHLDPAGSPPESEQDIEFELTEFMRGTPAPDDDQVATDDAVDEPEAPGIVDEETGLSPEDETALDRLLNETNIKLGERENNRKRSAIAHLKAAVAATKADNLLRGVREKDEARSLERYQADLDHAVRPKRPVPGGRNRPDKQERPSDLLTTRPAPLMLASDHRVDAQESVDPVAIRPRRVPLIEEDVDLEGFARFARSAGATELPDLLEAAAAYATFVEGQEDLTRPALLRRATGVAEGRRVSREQGLKSFGLLLRTGRIRKLGSGRFAVADSTRYVEAARAAAD